MQQPLPEQAARFLVKYHSDGVTEKDCLGCSSPCCSQGGFAILENVLQIYDLYRSGSLHRPDYGFAPDLTFSDFVFRYFEVYKKSVQIGRHERVVMLFHMKSLSPDGHLIEIPAVADYWETRAELFSRNPWLNRGCVFLSHGVGNWPTDDADSTRHCILHSLSSGSHVTAKPIDCVFYTCDRPIVARVPSEAQSSEWVRILADCFPNSLERFEQLIAPTRPENQTDSDTGYNHAVQPTAGVPETRLGKLWSKWRARRA